MKNEISRRDIGIISTFILFLLAFSIVEPFQISLLVGESMEPTIEDGSVIVYTQYSEIEKNDIIVFERENELIGHRVIDTEGEGFITKGDNNDKIDEGIVTQNNIQGEVIYYLNL